MTANWFGGFTLGYVSVGEAVLRSATAEPVRPCCCCTAIRLAPDHSAAVSHLAVIDGVPIGEALARCDAGSHRVVH